MDNVVDRGSTRLADRRAVDEICKFTHKTRLPSKYFERVPTARRGLPERSGAFAKFNMTLLIVLRRPCAAASEVFAKRAEILRNVFSGRYPDLLGLRRDVRKVRSCCSYRASLLCIERHVPCQIATDSARYQHHALDSAMTTTPSRRRKWSALSS